MQLFADILQIVWDCVTIFVLKLWGMANVCKKGIR